MREAFLAPYGAMAADTQVSDRLRHAAQRLLDTQREVDAGDHLAASSAAEEALGIFRVENSSKGIADALRVKYEVEAQEGSIGTDDEALLKMELLLEVELERFREQGDERGIASMLWCLADFHSRDGTKGFANALEVAGEGLAICRGLDDKDLLARLQYTVAGLHMRQQNEQEAISAAEECLELMRDLGDTIGEGRATQLLAGVHYAGQRRRDAMALAKSALFIYRRLGATKSIGLQLQVMAEWYLADAKPQEALPLAREAEAIFKEIGIGPSFQASSLCTVMQAMIDRGAAAQVVEVGEATLDQLRGPGLGAELVWTYDSLGEAYFQQGKCERALTIIGKGLEVCRGIGDARLEATVLRHQSHMYLRQHRIEEASASLQAARELCLNAGADHELIHVICLCIILHNERGDYAAVLEAVEDLRSVLQAIGDMRGMVTALLGSVYALAKQSNHAEAMALAVQAHDMSKEVKYQLGEMKSLFMIAQLHHETQAHDLAMDKTTEMRKLAAQIGDVKSEVDALCMLARIHLDRDAPETAAKLGMEARSLCRHNGHVRKEAETANFCAHCNIAVATKARLQLKQDVASLSNKAVKSSKDALAIAIKLGDKNLKVSATLNVAEALFMHGSFTDSLRWAQMALLFHDRAGNQSGVATATVLLAEIYQASGKTQQAKDAVSRGVVLARSCGDGYMESCASQLLHQMEGAPQEDRTVARMPSAQDVQGAEEAAPKVTREEIISLVTEVTNGVLSGVGVDEEVFLDTPLAEAGLDSLASVAFRTELQKHSGLSLPSTLMFDYPTQAALVDYMAGLAGL